MSPLLFYWATPVKLCSSVFCMLIDCLLHQFLGSIEERVCVPRQLHVVNELKQQLVDVRLYLSAISLITCRLDNIGKEVSPYFLDLTSSAPNSRSFMIFSKSARESHKLPPARLISACTRLLMSYLGASAWAGVYVTQVYFYTNVHICKHSRCRLSTYVYMYICVYMHAYAYGCVCASMILLDTLRRCC